MNPAPSRTSAARAVRIFSLAAALPLAAFLLTTAAGAQTTEGILSPGGRLRVELSPTFHHWDRRFGVHAEDGILVEGSEPLAYDLEHEPLLPLQDLESALGRALGAAPPALVLGSTRAVLAHQRTALTFSAALGVFDWLTVGARVPLVNTRTEVAFDFRALPSSNLGVSPGLAGDGQVATFLGQLNAGLGTLRARALAACPGPDCAALNGLVDEVDALAAGLATAYATSPLFPTAGSTAGVALEERLAALRATVDARAPDVVLPATLPLATGPLDGEEVTDLLTRPAAGLGLLRPLASGTTPWRLGDVEVSLALALLDGEVRDSASVPPRLLYRVGAQALARLPTGTVDDPDVPLDLGSGDGQLDVELGAFADLRWSRLGVRGDIRWGNQRPVDLVRRVAPPSRVMAPAVTRLPVRWTPGDYLDLELSSRWHLTDEFAVGALYRRFAKGSDSYALVTPMAGVDASVLELESEAKLHEAGVGLAFSTLTTWREGRTGFPFELRLSLKRAVAGNGGAVPDGLRVEGSGRVFWRLWGRASPSLP